MGLFLILKKVFVKLCSKPGFLKTPPQDGWGLPPEKLDDWGLAGGWGAESKLLGRWVAGGWDRGLMRRELGAGGWDGTWWLGWGL